MEDRLSDLPDDLLLHILSLLPSTKLQASTAILSKRWRHLWTRCSSLSFSYQDVLDCSHWEAYITRYTHFVDRCLQLSQATTVTRLRLGLPNNIYGDSVSSTAFDRWLSLAASRSVRELHLISGPSPSVLLQCRSLTRLKLRGCRDLHLPSSSPDLFPGFPSLKSLSLILVNTDRETIHVMLKISPLLERLVVKRCNLGEQSPHISVSGDCNPRLTDVVMDKYYLEAHVDSPHLRSIFFFGYASSLTLQSSPGLLRAGIFTPRSNRGFYSPQDWQQTLSAISQVRFLAVDDWFTKQISGSWNFESYGSGLKSLPNLKELHLIVAWFTGDTIYALLCILEKCPSLQKLSIEIDYISQNYETEFSKRHAFVGYEAGAQAYLTSEGLQLTLPELRSARFMNIQDEKRQIGFVEFLLSTAAALKSVVVDTRFDMSDEQLSGLTERLACVPKASPDADLIVKQKPRGKFCCPSHFKKGNFS